VEYDFVPHRLNMSTNDFLHVQWTGSNTHNNGDPAGDGQAGDAGEGEEGTDRHNIAQLLSFSDNYPMPLDVQAGGGVPTTMWTNSTCYDWTGTAIPGDNSVTPAAAPSTTCALAMAFSGRYYTVAGIQTATNSGGIQSSLLDDAPASLIGGIVMKFNAAAAGNQYNYMCTRNNNFSNRAQKGQIILNPPGQ